MQTQFSGVHLVQMVSYLNFRVHTYSRLERLRALADRFDQNSKLYLFQLEIFVFVRKYKSPVAYNQVKYFI